MDDNTFGDWLNDQLRGSGISRKELADAIGASPGSVNAWVGGYRWISGDNADKVADFFGESRNVVREMAGRPAASGPVPGLIGLRGSSGLTGVTSVAFIPIIGAAPHDASRTTAERGDVMPFAAEYAARFKQPGIIIITDDSLAHRGIRRGEGLLIEQDCEAANIRTGALVVLRDEHDYFSVATWYVDEAGAVTLIPASEQGPAMRFEPDGEGGPKLAGLVRSVFSVRSIE